MVLSVNHSLFLNFNIKKVYNFWQVVTRQNVTYLLMGKNRNGFWEHRSVSPSADMTVVNPPAPPS